MLLVKLLSKSQIFLKIDIQIYIGIEMQNFCFQSKTFARLIFFVTLILTISTFLYCIKLISELFAIPIQPKIQISQIQFSLLVDFWIISNAIFLNDCLQWYLSSLSVIYNLWHIWYLPGLDIPKASSRNQVGR